MVKLKIPNFSKLSKADLIAKILEAGNKTDNTTYPPPQAQAQAHAPTADDSTIKQSSNEKEFPQKKKEGNVKKRKATDQPGPSTKSFQEQIFKPVGATDSAQPETEAVTSRHAPSVSFDADKSIANTIITKAVKPKSSAQAKPKPAKKTSVITSASNEGANKPKSRSTTMTQIVAKPKPNPKPPFALDSLPPTIGTDAVPKAPVFWKTQTSASKSKSGSNKTLVKPAQPRFTGLTQTKPVAVTPSAPLAPEIKVDLSTFTARIKYIESHFINSLHALLHRYRAKSITTNYPCPASFLKSSKYKQTSHLAFQGFNPDIYDSQAGFEVAIRFWIARLHSSMQLGSGEAWSGRAGEMGMLGPDMATWPPVIAVERVTEEVWAIVTEEGSGTVRYLVMGEIGEVVATSKGITGNEVLVSGCVVRSDWARYLGSRSQRSIESMVKTKESYYFPNGVAKAWAGKQSETMIKIANRAVLASCALNRLVELESRLDDPADLRSASQARRCRLR